MSEHIVKNNSETTSNNKIKTAIDKVLEAGYQLQADAFNYLQTLSNQNDVESLINQLLDKLSKMSQPPLFIEKCLIQEILSPPTPLRKKPADAKVKYIEMPKTIFHPAAKDIEENIEIIKDPSKKLMSNANIKSFLASFRDRYDALSKILTQRLDVRGHVPIKNFLKMSPGTKVKIIGIISQKISKAKKVIIKIEDLEETATALIQPTNLDLFNKAKTLLLDQIVCVIGIKGNNDLIITENIILPDIPHHSPNRSAENINTILTSDLHIGSKMFEKTLFEKFITWINGKVDSEKEKEFVGRIKYVIIAGDLVDGVGQYPEQEKELEIKDIYKQYETVASYFEKIPDYIKLIVIPGNHDATRKTLPQPTISKKFAEPIYKYPNLLSLGNPAQIKLHEVNILIHHGRSLEDPLAVMPNINHHNVTVAMAHFLKSRHLAPVYGSKTPLAPEPKDWMVVESVPDVYHSGHIHVFGYSIYRDVKLVNSGSWQKQTIYQQKMNINPTYATLPIFNLQSNKLWLMNFNEMTFSSQTPLTLGRSNGLL